MSASNATKDAEVTNKVFFDVTHNDKPMGRIVMGLFGKVVPKTAANFLAIAKGTKDAKGKFLGYEGTVFHRVIPQFMLQGGDTDHANGYGGKSIYGDKFNDENFVYKHDAKYLLSMANAGKNTNGSQFFLTTVLTPHLNGAHVVFGRVLSGFEVVDAIEKLGSRSGSVSGVVKVAKSGELTDSTSA